MLNIFTFIRHLFEGRPPEKVMIASVTLQDISVKYRNSIPNPVLFDRCIHCGVLVSGAHNCSPKELRRMKRKLESEEKRAAITAAGKVTIPFPKRAVR